ncbi:MAG TPA: DUF481 domain-containing protein, partial [Candidatus Krumholzibacteria bacterium]|nr:DUF481 domain-containing protein [Candidatus Krumholzibacteria bacterium]
MILEGAQREIDFWSMKASLGLVGRSGNTDQIDLNTAVRIRRVSPRSRWEIKYNANYGKVSGTLLTDNHNLSSVWDMLVKAGFFVTPAAVNLFVDKFQNINLRTTVAAGAGYAIMRGGDVDWSANLGVGYVQTRYASVQALQDDTEGTFSLIPATNLDWDLTGDIELLFDYNVQLALPEPRNSYHHASATISFDIWGDILNLDASLTWDRAESPKARADGSVPKRDDFRSTIGFGIDLE